MLKRSFSSAKCKTALKLAVSRIKLLKNKREARVKQLKRELAKLLESGQDQIARIRVEHVVREEKTVAAYDLVEIFCELIAARLPIIESQKKCPIDLKEAISSVIFASPRCADIPELLDVRKHITAKYGKEFITAAVELRPDCGVNRLLVEKLSVKSPDGPTKIKILNTIAEEHNVRWEPKSFGENDVKSSHDFQIGPNTNNERASHVESPQVYVHIPPIHDEKGPSNLHASTQHKEMDDMPRNMYERNESFSAEMIGGSGNRSSTSSRSNPEFISSGTGSQEMDFKSSYSENKSDSPVGRQNWNMGFKDAASAAEAAAESAELASMAARAAAELSNREKMTRKFSTGFQDSYGSDFGYEVPQEIDFHDGKHFSAESANSKYGMHNEQINAREQNKNVVKHAKSASSMSASPFGGKASYPQFISPSGDHNDILERNIQKVLNNVAADNFDTDEGNTDRRNFKETSSSNNFHVGNKFENSSGPSSEIEEDLTNPKVAASHGHITRQKQHDVISGSSSMKDETVDSHWKSHLVPSSFDSDTLEEQFKRKIDITRKSQSCFKVSSSNDVQESNRSSHEAKTKMQHSSSLPSHVHPKLPDYDSIAAHFLSLKKARQ